MGIWALIGVRPMVSNQGFGCNHMSWLQPPYHIWVCPWHCDVTTMDASKAAMDTSNAALAQPVLALFTPHLALFAGPGLFPSSPYPLACPGGIWCCLLLCLCSPFWGFLRPTGPFLRARGCSHPTLSTGLPRGACRMPGAALAQPILGFSLPCRAHFAGGLPHSPPFWVPAAVLAQLVSAFFFTLL
jgi:hypothetical protein